MAVLVIYLLTIAIIGAIAFASWRLIGLQRASDVVPNRRSSPRGPDDDPDFLRSLDD